MKRLLAVILCSIMAIPTFAATNGTSPVTANRIVRGSGAPSAGTCNTAASVGKVYIRMDAAQTFHTFYVCANTASMTYAWELGGGGGGGSGCVPIGSDTDILTDDGAGACNSSSATIDSSGNGTFNSVTTNGNSAGMLSLTNNATPGTPVANSWGWTAPTTITTSWYGKPPNGSPSANNVMLFGAPSSNVSTWAWTGISGTGSFCMTTSCTMVTPILGTPASGVGTNLTGIPPGAVTSAQGNGTKFQLSTGSTTTNDCVKFDADGNTVDAGAACGTSSSSSGGTVVSKTVDYNAVSGDSGTVIYFNGSNKTYTLLSTVPTMPWIVGVCNINSTALTIARGTATIMGGTSNISLPQFYCTTLESDTATGGNNYVANVPVLGSSTLTCTPSSNQLVCSIPSSVALAGSPTTTTQSANDNSTKIATTAYVDATATANQKIRSFGATFVNGGSALVAGATTYFTLPYACTITAWNIAVDAGTATIDIWKIATGTAIPTVTNTITASATPAISTGTAIHSTTLTGWSTGVNVSANDIFGINLKTVSTATQANLTVQCNAI